MTTTTRTARAPRSIVLWGRWVRAARFGAVAFGFLAGCSGGDVTKPSEARIVTPGTFMGTTTVGMAIESPVHFVVTDEMGKPRSNVAVHFAPSGDGKVTISDAVSDNSGAVETRWTLGSAAGMQTLMANAREFAPQLFTANAIPDRAVAVNLNISSATLNLLGDTLRIVQRATDRYGNLVSGTPVFTIESGADAVALAGTAGVVARARGTARVRVQVDTARATFLVAIAPEPPVVDGIAQDTLVPGGPLVISGNNFALAPDAVDVTVAGVKATVVRVSPTRIDAVLPLGSAFPCIATGSQVVKVAIAGNSAWRGSALRVANRVSLNIGESQNLLDPSQVRCTELVEPNTAQRAKYVVAVLNTSVTAATYSGFELRASGGGAMAGQLASAKPQPSAVTAGSSLRVPGGMNALMQAAQVERDHGDFLEQQRRIVQQAGSPLPAWQRLRATKSGLSAMRLAPSVGDTISMKAIYSACNVGRDVRARVVYIGSKSIVLEDVLAPRAGQADAQYRAMGQEFDQVQYPLLRANIGDPLAMDATLGGDGRVTMLFTRYVNDSLPGIQGYATACNFYPKSTFAPSNEDEVFYARVPALTETPEAWRRSMRSTVLHESKHLASFAQRIATSTPFEESWLEESTARIAEELYSRTFAGGGVWKGNGAYASSVRCEIYQCDDRPLMMWKHFSVLHQFFSGVDTLTPIGAAASGDFTFYASGWSLVRWAADHYALNESQWLRDLVKGGAVTGLANLAMRTGHPVDEMLADWSLSNAISGQGRFVPKRAQLTFPSWNVPDIMAGLAQADPSRFSDASPLHVRAFTFGAASLPVSKLRAFSSSYFSFEGIQTGSEVFELRGENGGALPATLRVAIVRVE
jgi:hypothetical protein